MKTEIITTLLEWNPWFEEEIPKKLIGIRRAYDLISYLDIPEIKILEGVRRSGKSTLLYQIVDYALKHEKKVLYINFDDETLKKYSLSDIYEAFLERTPIDYLLVDEIQQCNNWVPFIRKCYDRKILDQIWITGSNSSLIRTEYAELLTGRNIKLSIKPLSFQEYLNFKQMDTVQYPCSPNMLIQLKVHFENYLTYGAFPAIVLRTVHQRALLLAYFEDFLYKDIAARHAVNATKLKELAIYLTTNATKIVSYRKIAAALGLHPNTISEYIHHMKSVFLFDELYKFDYSLKKQFSHDKKLYVVDTGLAHAVSFRFSEEKGRMLENLVYQHFKRQQKEIYFHKSKKHECDFIIKEGLDIVQVVQVTTSLSNPNTKAREVAGLLDAMQSYQLTTGFIFTLHEENEWYVETQAGRCKIIVKAFWGWLLTQV